MRPALRRPFRDLPGLTVAVCSLLTAVCYLPAAPPAPAIKIQGVNRAEFWAFRKDWATSLEDKLDLDIRYGDLKGSLGLFLFEPSKPWTKRQPLNLADYTFAYSPKQFEILYGKYFQAFGKGLALRTYSDDDFRHYKSLHGLRGTARLPLKTEVVLLGGRLRDIFFQENNYKVLNWQSADTFDQLLGANLETRPFKFLGLGGRYVRANRDKDFFQYQDTVPRAFTELFGGNVSTGYGPVSLYGEVCWRQGVKPLIGGRDRGFGYYLDAAVALRGVSLVGQYVDYKGLAVPIGQYHYNDPPTPIKSGVAINRGQDERGFGIIATASPIRPLYLEANFGTLWTHDTKSNGVTEWEGKARYVPGSNFTLEGKFNHMLQKDVELGTMRRTTNRPTVNITRALGKHYLALEAEYGFVAEEPTDTAHGALWNYHEPIVAVSYGYGPLLFTLGWQGVDKDSLKRYDNAKSWPMFETVWSITERNVLRVRLGAEKGGYTCSGGVCRYEAPFTGLKLQIISRF